MTFQLTPKQKQLNGILASDATHIMAYGGSRSGKTFGLVRAVLTRALAHKSRHAMLRYRFNHIKASIVFDTLPKVMDLCFPGVAEHCRLDKTDWFYALPNGSEVWFGGLDDKERTEKILGQEYCVDPASLVLRADLQWVPAKDIRVGDELIGFPEDLEGHIKLTPSAVERHEVIQAQRYRIVTTHGETVVSAQHQFVGLFDDRRHRNFRLLSWRKASDLRVGDRVRYTTKPWQAGESREDGWFAGMLDGEGWVSRPARMAGVAQCEGPVLDALRSWLDRNEVVYFDRVGTGKQGKRGACHKLTASGLWASLRMLGIAQPKRLNARAIWEDCRAFTAGGYDAEIIAIEDLGVGPVVSMGTSTKTFIADGFLAHNCTIYLNECSQIPWASRNMAMTRLAQNTPLRLKAYYDCNPPGMGHWTYQVFVQKRDPDRKTPFRNPEDFAALVMNPRDNEQNLPATYLAQLEGMSEAMRRRFLLGQFADVSETALWTLDLLDQQRIVDGKVPDMRRIIIAVDPSGCQGEEDKRSDEIGMVVVGLGVDGRAYVLEDLSGKMKPADWGQAAVAAYDRHDADCIVGEENFGGAMVAEIIRSAAALGGRAQPVPYKSVKASRGKIVRAEPIAALFQQQKVSLVGYFPELEDQLTAMTTAGYMGDRSPDRADAMVWALSELFPAVTKRDDRQHRPVQRVNVGHSHMKRRRA